MHNLLAKLIHFNKQLFGNAAHEWYVLRLMTSYHKGYILLKFYCYSWPLAHFCLCPFPAPRKEIINVYFHLFIHFSFPTVFFRGGFLLFFPNRYLSLPFYFIIFFPGCTNPLFLYLLTLYHLFAILSSLSVSYYPTFPFFSMKNHLFLKNNNNKCRKKNIQLGMYLYICLQLNI